MHFQVSLSPSLTFLSAAAQQITAVFCYIRSLDVNCRRIFVDPTAKTATAETKMTFGISGSPVTAVSVAAMDERKMIVCYSQDGGWCQFMGTHDACFVFPVSLPSLLVPC